VPQLDFYGLRLVDKHTGQVKRAKHWLSRYQNMNSHTHNNLRISTQRLLLICP
jgi:hypothetical protein